MLKKKNQRHGDCKRVSVQEISRPYIILYNLKDLECRNYL